MTHSIKYRPDIDVLRAIAVLPVIFFHLDKTLIPGGYLGVDVFFVISGYLITRIFAADLENGHIDFLGFWRRRILRILPALLVMVTVTYVLGQWLLFAPDRRDLAINSSAALLSFSNITHWLNYGGYWGADAVTSPLLHTWSLGVEEQFYLLYPMFMWLVWRLRKSALTVVLAAVLLASIGLFLYGLQTHPTATFYLLPTRAWELAAGALAATINWNPSGRAYAAKLLAWTGLALVLCSYAFASSKGLGYWTLAAVAGATLVVGVGTDEPFRAIGFNNRPLIFIGLISYSLYLWHWPVIVLANAVAIRYGFVLPLVALFILIVALAYCSWRFIEIPMRRAKRLAPAIAAAAAMVALVVYGARGLNSSEDTSSFKSTKWAGNEFNVNPKKEWPESVKRRMDGIQVTWQSDTADAYSGLGILRKYGGDKIDVLVLGDSHGLMWAPVVDDVLKSAGKTVSYMTADGTPVFFGIPVTNGRQSGFFSEQELRIFRHAVLRIIREQQPSVVVIGASWGSYSAEDAKSLLNEIAKINSRILLIGDPPILNIGDRNAHQYAAFLGIVPNSNSDTWIEHVDIETTERSRQRLSSIRQMCGRHCDAVTTEDLFFRIRKDIAEVRLVSGREVLYIDDDHVSVAGAQIARGRIQSKLMEQFILKNVTVFQSNVAQP